MIRTLLAALVVSCVAVPAAHAQSTSAQAAARAIAKEAYIYGFPLVDSYRIQYSYFVDRGGPAYKGPWNQISHDARVHTPEDKAMPSPSVDTASSYLGADLRTEPLVLTVPAVEKGRFYDAQFIDSFTFNFAYVGTRATGNGAGSFLLAGPRWKGGKPSGVKAVIRSETDFVLVLYRTQLFNPGDIENVRKVQAGYRAQTLSAFLGKPAPRAAPPIDFPKPLTAAEERTSLEFFNLMNFVLEFCAPHPSEKALMARFARLGIGAGRIFDLQALLPGVRQGVEDGVADAWQAVAAAGDQAQAGKITSADLYGTRKSLKNNYLERMLGAVGGIHGHSKQEALSTTFALDSAGQKLDAASHRYALHFAAGRLPPVNAFWSVTLYELPSQLLSANPFNRYAITSPMLPGLKRDADGGLTIHVQHESPGEGREANWLPAPAGMIMVTVRLYQPRSEVQNGKWKVPPLQRVN